MLVYQRVYKSYCFLGSCAQAHRSHASTGADDGNALRCQLCAAGHAAAQKDLRQWGAQNERDVSGLVFSSANRILIGFHKGLRDLANLVV
jgi:hypothetical protein